MNISISKREFSETELSKIDPRILKAMEGWKVTEQYRGSTVHIPGTWGSEIYPYKYFEIYKSETDPNAGESENEIQCYMSCGWLGTDDEVIIVLTILGTAVLNNGSVGAEIYKLGSAPTKVYRHGRLITDFTKKQNWLQRLLCDDKVDKVIVKCLS